MKPIRDKQSPGLPSSYSITLRKFSFLYGGLKHSSTPSSSQRTIKYSNSSLGRSPVSHYNGSSISTSPLVSDRNSQDHNDIGIIKENITNQISEQGLYLEEAFSYIHQELETNKKNKISEISQVHEQLSKLRNIKHTSTLSTLLTVAKTEKIVQALLSGSNFMYDKKELS